MIEKINAPEDLRNLCIEDLTKVADDIRHILIKKASLVGGHFASNLGVVELTIAIHYVFNTPFDKVVFDVSHQCYPHKILTGRKDAYLFEEKYDTVTGFTNPDESAYDLFDVGHTSTSISLALGLAKARDLSNGTENVIALIGDAALGGGEALEALNISTEITDKLIIILNDNDMSIPESHGAIKKNLQELRKSEGRLQNNIFRELGFEYLFVKDGHDINSLIGTLQRAKDCNKPVIVHCCTKKGKGYSFAESNPEKWHHAHPFDVSKGEFHKYSSVPKENYGSIVGELLEKRTQQDPLIVAMTASVPACFGFNYERRKRVGRQFIDVGISEQNLITMAAALAKGNVKPIVVTESSFYQRAYDQFEQELSRNNCPATFLVTFSGIYAHNDDTHIGFFDIALLGNIPNIIYLAPSNKQDYISMLNWSIDQSKHPVIIRVPWNGVHYSNHTVLDSYDSVQYRTIHYGTKVAILGLGSFFQLAEEVANLVNKELGFEPTLIDPMFVSGFDQNTLNRLLEDHELVVTLEDGIISGGFGSKISQYYSISNMKVLNCGFSMDIPRKFSTYEMLEKNELYPSQILEKIRNSLSAKQKETR